VSSSNSFAPYKNLQEFPCKNSNRDFQEQVGGAAVVVLVTDNHYLSTKNSLFFALSKPLIVFLSLWQRKGQAKTNPRKDLNFLLPHKQQRWTMMSLRPLDDSFMEVRKVSVDRYFRVTNPPSNL